MKKPQIDLAERPLAHLELACLHYVAVELAKALPERDYHLIAVLKDALATCHVLLGEKARLEEQIMAQRQEIITLTGRLPKGSPQAVRKALESGRGEGMPCQP